MGDDISLIRSALYIFLLSDVPWFAFPAYFVWGINLIIAVPFLDVWGRQEPSEEQAFCRSHAQLLLSRWACVDAPLSSDLEV